MIMVLWLAVPLSLNEQAAFLAGIQVGEAL
jgi:hypothetical protein